MKRILFLYILAQIIPTFLLGVAVFMMIIVMTQLMQLSEFLLEHGIGIAAMGLVVFNMMISFLPMIMPMSLLFAVLLTYARLSSDSEIVAFKSLGHSQWNLTLPALAFSAVIAVLSAQTLFVVGPVARYNYNTLIRDIGKQKIMSAIQAGTFSENFFDLTLYTNEVDSKHGTMKNLFIYDNRTLGHPRIIVAREGSAQTGSGTGLQHPGAQQASLLLRNGTLYSTKDSTASQIAFETYNLTLSEPVSARANDRDIDTYTFDELRTQLKKPGLSEEKRKDLGGEVHKRTSTAAACLIFGVLGATLGSSVNRRSTASSGFVLSIICIILYWTSHTVVVSLVPHSSWPPAVLLWLPNIVFALATLWLWRNKERA